jgi:hypothetical protein
MQDADARTRRGAEGDADPTGAGAECGPDYGVQAADLRAHRGRARRARRRGGDPRGARGDDGRGGRPAAGDSGGAVDGDRVRDVGDGAVGAYRAGRAERRRRAADAGLELHVREPRRGNRRPGV